MLIYNWSNRLSNSKSSFARKCVSKLRSPFRVMNYIRRDSSELTRSVLSLKRAIRVYSWTKEKLDSQVQLLMSPLNLEVTL